MAVLLAKVAIYSLALMSVALGLFGLWAIKQVIFPPRLGVDDR